MSTITSSSSGKSNVKADKIRMANTTTLIVKKNYFDSVMMQFIALNSIRRIRANDVSEGEINNIN